MLANHAREPGAPLNLHGRILHERHPGPAREPMRRHPHRTGDRDISRLHGAGCRRSRQSRFFLFAAGQDTSAKLNGTSLRYLAENSQTQQSLREDPALIADFIEEMLRQEGSITSTFRLAKRTTEVGSVRGCESSRQIDR